jgi:hypothetical protein
MAAWRATKRTGAQREESQSTLAGYSQGRTADAVQEWLMIGGLIYTEEAANFQAEIRPTGQSKAAEFGHKKHKNDFYPCRGISVRL